MEIRRLREQRRIDPLISTTPIQLPLYNRVTAPAHLVILTL